MKATRMGSFLALTSLLVLAAAPGLAQATTWNVPGDMSNTCTIGNPSCDTIQGAINASTDGDDIQVAAGTFAETNIAVNKSLTINGAGAANTFVQPSGIGFGIQADGVTISNLTVEDGTQAFLFATPGVDGTVLDTVTVQNNSSRGIEITSSITGLTVTDSTFTNNNIGIRMASTSTVDGLDVIRTTFDTHTLAIYQANDGNTSTLNDLLVSDCDFLNNSDTAAVYAEEIRNSTIENSTFTNQQRGILIFKFFTTSGVNAGNVSINGNEFSGSTAASIQVQIQTSALDGPIGVLGNSIEQDVGLLTANVPAIDIRLASAFTHSLVTVSGNDVTLSGTFGAATAAYGIGIRGNGPVALSSNVLDGGSVGSVATNPPTSGVYIRSTDTNVAFGQIPATATITGNCNDITGFVNGLSVYSPVAADFGGLLPGTTVDLDDGTIAGNSGAGAVNGASPTITLENTWWGCAAGPGQPGCDTTVGDVDFEPFATADLACGLQPLTVTKFQASAQKAGNSKGKIGGNFEFAPPPGEFVITDPVTIQATDGGTLDQSVTFAVGECIQKGTKFKCKTADKQSSATFAPSKKVPGTLLVKFKMKSLPIDGPFIAPGTVTLTYGPDPVVRTGSLSSCVVKSTKLKCKA